MNNLDIYLAPTLVVDSDSKIIQEKVENLTNGLGNMTESAVRMFYFVRDGIKYNPYDIPRDIDGYKASYTMQKGFGFCVTKAILLTALGRAAKIPTRLGFANLINHHPPQKLLEVMKTDIFYYHGFCEFYIDEKWIAATPAFDKEMCEKTGLKTVEFDGKTPAVLHKTDLEGKPSIDYLKYYEPSHDLPFEEIKRKWMEAYEYMEL